MSDKAHHVHDRSIEHAKSRDFAAHRLIAPGAPETGYRSTRGFAAVKGQQPALDVQPRHGGKAKGGGVKHSWGNTEQANRTGRHPTSDQERRRCVVGEPDRPESVCRSRRVTRT